MEGYYVNNQEVLTFEHLNSDVQVVRRERGPPHDSEGPLTDDLVQPQPVRAHLPLVLRLAPHLWDFRCTVFCWFVVLVLRICSFLLYIVFEGCACISVEQLKLKPVKTQWRQRIEVLKVIIYFNCTSPALDVLQQLDLILNVYSVKAKLIQRLFFIVVWI